jgi:hypothetical protein
MMSGRISMLIAAGDGYSRWLNIMHELKRKGLVDLVYPEFFDDKDSLIAKRWRAYIRRLRRYADTVKVAVWPDYCYDARLRDRFNIEWVFPLHSKRELDFALRVADYVAFPNRDDLRDYSIAWFLEQRRIYGFRAWLLGLKPRYLKAYVLQHFDACDITGASLKGFLGKGWKNLNDVEVWEGFVRQIKAAKTIALDPWLKG